jgi:L-threonylcarbamoyladenylate synthase
MQVIKLNQQKICQDKLVLIIDFLKQGKVILFPTDTVYGFLTDATNRKGVEKIFKIKKRLKTKPISLFVRDLKMAKKFATINNEQEKILKKIWTGEKRLTAVLKRKNIKEKLYGVKKDTIAIRVPNYKPLNLLLKKIDFPLAQTSANISGEPTSGKIKEIIKEFKNKKNRPDLIVDAGNLPRNKPSTIINLTTLPPKILRI